MDPLGKVLVACFFTWFLIVTICALVEDVKDKRKAAKAERRRLHYENAKLRAQLRTKEVDICVLQAQHGAELDRLQADNDRLENLLQQKWAGIKNS